jgi:hypothetical protein
MVMRIINSTVHENTGVSPAELMMPWINIDRLLVNNETENTEETKPLSQWSQRMLQVHLRLINAAQHRQEMSDNLHLADRPQEITVFAPNSYVLMTYPEGAMGARPPNKFDTNLKGPLKVIRSVGSKYTLLNLITNKLEEVHVTRLRPFYYDPAVTDPANVASKDYQEFKVAQILRHEGSPARYGQMDFLVRWEGYGPEDDLWLPWQSLRNNPVLHEYLFQHNLTRIIPREHKTPYLARHQAKGKL